MSAAPPFDAHRQALATAFANYDRLVAHEAGSIVLATAEDQILVASKAQTIQLNHPVIYARQCLSGTDSSPPFERQAQKKPQTMIHLATVIASKLTLLSTRPLSTS